MEQLEGLQELEKLLNKSSQTEMTYRSSIEQFTRTLFTQLNLADANREANLALLFRGINELTVHMFNMGVIAGHGLTSLGFGDVAVGIVTGEINMQGGESNA